MRFIKKFPLIRQFDKADCALACLRMLCKYYHFADCFDDNNYQYYISKDGVALDAVVEIARLQHFDVACGKISIEQLAEEALLPCILFWDKNHFVVLYDIKTQRGKKVFKIADPDKGKMKYSLQEFKKHWCKNDDENNKIGIAILLEPNTQSLPNILPIISHEKVSLIPVLGQYKKMLAYIVIGICIGALIQLVFPFLTQSIVDVGIKDRNLDFIFVILLGQMLLITGNMFNDFLRKCFVLRLGSCFSIKLLTDLVGKLLKLPVRFFDSKHIGDFLQRLQDHDKVERFITTHFVNFLFSVITLLVLSVVLIIYSKKIFLIFFVGSVLYILWTFIFISKRKRLNYTLFSIKARNQSKYHEIIKGISEIKLQNSMQSNQKEIEEIQKDIYEVNSKALRIDQYLETGNIFINELKNIIITFFSAYLVIKNDFTLGAMLSIQYIIGQLNVPICQFITFINGFQDAKLSLDRMNNIFIKKDEDKGSVRLENIVGQHIVIKNLNFKYLLSGNDVLKNINLRLSIGQVIAIVGASGSGKTTLVKLLLKLYEPTEGIIKIGNTDLHDIETSSWRNNCGAVLQDGYIFSNSIKNNIIMSVPYDEPRFLEAARISNIEPFVDDLTYRYDTMIGDNGINLSQGQKQRILIARAIYKSPEILFFDEATNALDANNEKIIVENLHTFLNGKTAFIVAHRLSTVKDADIILVLDYGRIVEQGTHDALVKTKGYYYQLIKNQLELGM